jgi:hypothetical protein
MENGPTFLAELERPRVVRAADGGGAAGRLVRGRRNARWFAAELLVVVLGVLLALAVNGQAQRLREHRLALEYTARISEDLDRFAASLEGVIAWSGAVRAAGDLVAPVLDGADPGDDAPLVLAAAYQAARMRRPDLSPIAYRELLATGQIRLFRDPGLRQQLGAYFADLERAGTFLELDGEYSAIVRRTLPIQVQTSIHDGCENTEQAQACPLDLGTAAARAELDRLAAQPQVAAALRLRIMHQHFTLAYAQQQYAANRALRERLDQGGSRPRTWSEGGR